MSNRETRRTERRSLPRSARVIELPRRPVPQSAGGRRRLLGLITAGFVAAAVVLGSFTILPPAVGNDPSPALVARMRERGVTVERLDAAALEALETAKSPSELFTAAANEVGGLTPVTEVVRITARDPNPAPGTDPITYDQVPAYAYTFTGTAEAPINFGGGKYRVVIILVDPFSGSPLIGAGFEEQIVVSPAPSASPLATPTP
jgi:hypothetical protein